VKLVDTDDYKVTDRYPFTQAEFERQFSFKGKFDASKAGQNVQRGEVCMRGPGVCLGYYKKEKETREVIDSQGWLHTGDIGQWNPDGSLSIIDRKKNIFKLAQGEYVAPEAVEAACTPSKFVSQIFVYGNSLETNTVAIVVPDKDTIMPWAKSKGINGSLKDVCNNAQVKGMILEDMKLLATQAGVKGYEMPKDIWLEGNVNHLGQGFNIENDCLTPTMKMKRPQLQKRYQQQIDAMYAGLKGKK
jgi:long-chain acyl-CoA synthetase